MAWLSRGATLVILYWYYFIVDAFAMRVASGVQNKSALPSSFKASDPRKIERAARKTGIDIASDIANSLSDGILRKMGIVKTDIPLGGFVTLDEVIDTCLDPMFEKHKKAHISSIAGSYNSKCNHPTRPMDCDDDVRIMDSKSHALIMFQNWKVRGQKSNCIETQINLLNLKEASDRATGLITAAKDACDTLDAAVENGDISHDTVQQIRVRWERALGLEGMFEPLMRRKASTSKTLSLFFETKGCIEGKTGGTCIRTYISRKRRDPDLLRACRGAIQYWSEEVSTLLSKQVALLEMMVPKCEHFQKISMRYAKFLKCAEGFPDASVATAKADVIRREFQRVHKVYGDDTKKAFGEEWVILSYAAYEAAKHDSPEWKVAMKRSMQNGDALIDTCESHLYGEKEEGEQSDGEKEEGEQVRTLRCLSTVLDAPGFNGLVIDECESTFLSKTLFSQSHCFFL